MKLSAVFGGFSKSGAGTVKEIPPPCGLAALVCADVELARFSGFSGERVAEFGVLRPRYAVGDFVENDALRENEDEVVRKVESAYVDVGPLLVLGLVEEVGVLFPPPKILPPLENRPPPFEKAV